jgi:DinB superfamily
MQETAQQYTQRILEHLGGKPALRVQQSTPKKLALLTKHLDRKRLAKRPAPGKWSVAEILAHLADSELAIGWRLRMMLTSNGTPIQGYDQDAWAATFNYARRDPKVSLETFRVLRENNVALLKTVPKNLLENYYMHSERGKETVAHFTNMIAGHDLNHLQQVEKIVKSPGGRKS